MTRFSSYTYVVLGGGIAGVSCLEQISYDLADNETALLITASPLVKAVTNVQKLTKLLVDFDVEEKDPGFLTQDPRLSVLIDKVRKINPSEHEIIMVSESCIKYEKLCICTGGSPKLIAQNNPLVLGIRDTDSVVTFQNRMKDAKRIVVVGNGGIATELVYELQNVEVVWAIKNKSVSATFVDPGAAEFFLSSMRSKESKTAEAVSKRLKYTVSPGAKKEGPGSALGPDWHSGLQLHGQLEEDRKIVVEYECKPVAILQPCNLTEEQRARVEGWNEEWPIFIELSNGKIYGCDVIVSATGVKPFIPDFSENCLPDIAEDGGLLVNEFMLTSQRDVYAAGDTCTVNWDTAPHWFQMRLWTQARQLGAYAGLCMVQQQHGETPLLDFTFELFAHVTRFFGYKVVLLGCFNGQKLSDYEIMVRITLGVEYVKLVIKDGKVQGAIFIGETDLEETFENLILNQLDISIYGEDILNPDIDIEDYFD